MARAAPTARFYHCSVCGKGYRRWRWAARHLVRQHDGAGMVEQHDVAGCGHCPSCRAGGGWACCYHPVRTVG